jgi:putative N6-adenine-specific DNA methylase
VSPAPTRERFFATCAPGLEPVLHAEARALRLAQLERQVGGVAFRGTLTDAWRANLELRTAIRVLMQVARFGATNADELRAGVGAVDWRRFVRPDGSLAVKAQSTQSALDHTMFVAQCAKDGIVDRLREATGQRPSVDKDDPDLRVHVHLVRDRCRVLVDTSGESLHKRGWRRFQGRAPLSETLAAGVVLLSGWDRRAPLLDPFCGSASLLIEAALIASDTAPGLFRERFGFERLPGHDAAGWQRMRAAARERSAFPRKLTLWGCDRDAKVIEGARENLSAASLEGHVQLEVADALDFAPRPGWNAWIASNLPYGERVGDAARLEPLLRRFGTLLRERCGGYHAALLSGDPALSSALALPAPERIALKNGGLDCELLLASL